jgi:dipeptidyl aminopeptidase/acylaminoacyl peptidase
MDQQRYDHYSFRPSITSINWSSDDRYLYFTAQSNGGVPLYRLDVPARKVEQLTDFNSGITSFDIAGNKIVFAKTEVKIHRKCMWLMDWQKHPGRSATLTTG